MRDGDWLLVQCRKMCHRVHRDVPDGLRSRCQLYGAGGRGRGRCGGRGNVGYVLGARLGDVINRLDDRGM